MQKKTRRLLVAALVLLASVIVLAHLYRDAIARRVANAALGDLDVEVTSVSIKSIERHFVHFDSLELRQADGGKIRIADFALPLDAGAEDSRGFRIGVVQLEPAADSAPALFADLLQTLIDAPDSAPHSSYRIDRLLAAQQPPVTEVVWTPGNERQTLAFGVAGYRFSVDVLRISRRHHSIMVFAKRPDSDEPLLVTLQLFATPSGFSISAEGEFRLSPILPVLHDLGIAPPPVTELAGTLKGPVYLELSRDASRQMQLSAQMAATEALRMSYLVEPGRNINLQATLPVPVDITFDYPSLRWSAATPRADVLVDSRSIADLRADLLDVRCLSGVQCSWTAKIDAANVSLGDWRLGRAQVMSPMQASIGESIEVSISTATAVSGTDIRYGDYKVRAISLREFAGATFRVANGGWQARLPASTIRLQSLRPLELLESSFDLQLQDTQFEQDGDRLESGFRLDPATATVSYRGIDIAVPAAAGTFTIEDDRQSANVRLSGAKRGISAALSFTERPAGGELRVQDATFDMRRRSLATWLKRRGDAWNVIDGLVRANLTLLWSGQGDDRSYDGQIELNAAGLAGNYEELVFTGLDLGLKADVEDDLSARIDPVDLRLGLLDAGVPLTNLDATLIPDPAMSTLQVERLGFEILGGSMHAQPFLWRRDSNRTEVLFEVRRIQPALMLALADFNSVEIDGSLSGNLPLLLVGEKVLIEGGRLGSEAPGGTIRYRPEVPVERMKKDSSQLGTVTRALGNFHYESLSCDVNYAENGDLRLQMRIQGVNPDMDPNQPVILNLGLDNNVPQLLRSLQATRSIEDILERRASQ